MSRVLVTGGAGFIGRHVVARLLADGHAVTVLDDLSRGDRDAIPGARLVVGDLSDPAALADALTGVDRVAHLAARVSIRASVEGLEDDFRTNLAGTVGLLQRLEGTGVQRFVLASSMAVYDDSEDGRPVTEDHPTVPRAPYGVAKLAAEQYTRLVCERLSIVPVVLRYFNTWGPGQTPSAYVGLITVTIQRLLDGEAPVIIGDGEQRRDFIHVDDVARATVRALADDAPGGVYNVGTGVGRTVNEVVAALRGLVDGAPLPVFEPARPEELRCSVADIARIERAFGWSPAHVALELGPLVDAWRARRADPAG